MRSSVIESGRLKKLKESRVTRVFCDDVWHGKIYRELISKAIAQPQQQVGGATTGYRELVSGGIEMAVKRDRLNAKRNRAITLGRQPGLRRKQDRRSKDRYHSCGKYYRKPGCSHSTHSEENNSTS